MLKRLSLGLAVAACVLMVSSVASGARKWKTFKSDKYGFEMLIPAKTTLASKDLGGGWGALWAKSGPATLWGVAKLGKQHGPDEIEDFGVKVTGIPPEFWKLINKDKNSGWLWRRMYRASNAKWTVLAVLGVGPKGTYLLIVKTTTKDAKRYAADYEKWALSCKLI